MDVLLMSICLKDDSKDYRVWVWLWPVDIWSQIIYRLITSIFPVTILEVLELKVFLISESYWTLRWEWKKQKQVNWLLKIDVYLENDEDDWFFKLKIFYYLKDGFYIKYLSDVLGEKLSLLSIFDLKLHRDEEY